MNESGLPELKKMTKFGEKKFYDGSKFVWLLGQS